MSLEKLLDYSALDNIAETLDDDLLGDIGAAAVRDYETDKRSRSEWWDNCESALQLTNQVREAKSWPWDKASNVKYPLLTVAVTQFNAQVMPMVLPNRNIVKGKVVGSDPGGLKHAKASRIERHMSWQLLDQMRDWQEGMDQLLIQLPVFGNAFKKTYFDDRLGRNVSNLVHAQNFVVNHDSVENLETAPCATEVLCFYTHEVHENQRMGLWLDTDLGLDVQQEAEGASRTHEFIEQHRLWDLDDDGYEEPYIVTVHCRTQKVVRIVARFDETGIIAAEDGEVLRIEPVCYYTKYGFIPNPDGGFYDLGYGQLLGHINEAVNSILNQMIDAGTLANSAGGFIGRGLRLRGGDLHFAPFEWKQINFTGDDIRKNIVRMDFNGPSTVLFSLLGLLIEAGQEIGSIKDVLSGEGPRNAPATTTLALIEQGMKTFTAITKRTHRSLGEEYRKLYRLNGIYMDPEEYFEVLDPEQKEYVGQQAFRDDYNEKSIDVVPVSDPNMVSDTQKILKAEALAEEARNNPLVDPKKATIRKLQALGYENPQELMQEQQPGPEQLEAMAKLKHDRMRAEAAAEKDMAEAQKLRMETFEAWTRGLHNIAKAEGEEPGRQLDAYKSLGDMMLKKMELEQRRMEAKADGSADTGNGNTGKGMAGQSGNPAPAPDASPPPGGLPPGLVPDDGLGGPGGPAPLVGA